MWVKIDDRFFHNPKIRRAGKDGRELYLAGLTYVNAQLTDGFIHRDDIAYIASWAEVMAIDETAARLVELHLWEPVKDGYLIHDYHDYNPTREEALATKAARAEAGRIGGQRSGESRREAKEEAKALAKSNPVPVPEPVPVPGPFPVPNETETEGAVAPQQKPPKTISPNAPSELGPYSEGECYYMARNNMKAIRKIPQREVLRQTEDDVGLPTFKRAVDWIAAKGKSDVHGIQTTARKMASDVPRGNGRAKAVPQYSASSGWGYVDKAYHWFDDGTPGAHAVCDGARLGGVTGLANGPGFEDDAETCVVCLDAMQHRWVNTG